MSCVRLLPQLDRRAASRAACTAGNSSATRMPMIAITTRSSTSVKARREVGYMGSSCQFSVGEARIRFTVGPICKLAIYGGTDGLGKKSDAPVAKGELSSIGVITAEAPDEQRISRQYSQLLACTGGGRTLRDALHDNLFGSVA